MSNTFEILAKFLERWSGEVEGREGEEPEAELRDRLRRFAAGELPAADRNQVVAELRQHPAWVSLLAEEVKAMRPSTE